MAVIDFNSVVNFGQNTFLATVKGLANVHRTNCFLITDRLPAKTFYANEDFSIQLNQVVYALDSTTIDLCLSLFLWAKYRKHEATVKVHTLMDLRGSMPCFIRITDGKGDGYSEITSFINERSLFVQPWIYTR
jgi:hypothetical protein